MNKMNKIFLGSLTAVAATAITAGSVYAGQGFLGKMEKRNIDPANKEAMDTALENNDYAAWKSLAPANGKNVDAITEANFAKFAEAHKLMEAGKTEEARKILDELGLKGGKRMGMPPGESAERHEAMQKAFETKDYNAWKTLMKNNKGRAADVITEANFAKFAEAHLLMNEGKQDEAKKIFDELGVKGPGDSKGFNRNHERGEKPADE